MKTLDSIKNENGIALVAAMVIMLLLLVLGTAAMQMSQFGFTAISAEKKYQLANWTAEYGVKKGIEAVVSNAICPVTGVTNVSSGTSSYSYYGIKDSTDAYCFIHGKGQNGSATVYKTVVVPRAGTTWAGMVTRGGSIILSGSSAIAGCDDDESTYANKCGIVPAVIYQSGQLTYNQNQVQNPITACSNEGTLNGFEGNPALQPTNLPNDLTPLYFGVTDTDNSGSAWDELLEKLEIHYSNLVTTGKWRKIEFYDQTKTLLAEKFGLPTVPLTAPGAVPNACLYNSNAANRCCKTSIVGGVSYIECYNNSGCTGTAPTNVCDGQVTTASCRINISDNTCKQTQTVANAANYPYIAVGDDTVAFVSINTGLRVPTNISGHRIALVGSIPVDITTAVNNTRIYTGGAVTINDNLSYTANDPGSVIYAGGNVTFGANVGNHGSDSCGAADTATDPMSSATHIISAGDVTINSQNIRNTNVFANNIIISSQPDIQGGKANIFYALNGLTVSTNGSPCFGYPCGNNNNLYPVMILVGDGDPATGGSSISMPGNLTISGMMFTDATTISITGAVEFQGTIINTSTNNTITNTGNGTIQFNKRVLDGLYAGLCSSIMQEPKCGGGNKGDYLSNTKTTVY